MKKLFIISAIAISGLVYNTADAQFRLHLGFRFGHPRFYAPAPIVVEQAPVYQEPVANYDENAPAYNNSNDDYYYLPDVDAYYDVTDQCYFYFDGDNWISAAYLPGAYRDYDWRYATRYEVRAPRPYLHNEFYRSRYNGHPFNDWAHANFNNHFDHGYAGRDARQDEHRFDNRGQEGFDHRNDNRAYNQRFDNRGQANFDHRNVNRGYDQHFDNRAHSEYSQPAQPTRGNDQRFNNKGNGGYSQPSQPARGNDQHGNNRDQGGNGQPSNQNGGHARDTRSGGDQHIAQYNPRGFNDHRMSRF